MVSRNYGRRLEGAMKKLIMLTLLLSGVAQSDCRMSYVCDDYGGDCEYMDICDDALDLPSFDVPPIPALPSTEVKPLPSLELPPLGTSECEYKQVNGEWQNVCR